MKIISGGQTGVDRAALDAALDRDLPCGGWCPQGRRAEDGPIPARYPLQETPTPDYPDRTERNVQEGDATLILTRGRPDCGTALTRRLARRHARPCLVIDLAAAPPFATVVVDWLEENNVRILNVAGPRESSQPGIYQQARAYLEQVLTEWQARS
jgi:hypothetical protein